ncbi:MAG TPA: LysM domain-containing protein [Anaerolineales bacterium]
MKTIILVTLACILALLSTASPARAATCQDTYTVQAGDFLIKIAAEYDGISFLDIARTNNLEAPYTILRGQKLCIPEPGAAGSTGGTTGGVTGVTSSNFSLRRQGDRLRVSVEDLQRSETYFVKVADADKSSLEWFKVGVLSTDRDREGQGNFDLPADLRNADSFIVCLKNVVTDDLICSDPGLTRFAEDDDDDDSGSATKAAFTAARLSGGRILITTSRFPEDSFWKVRVRVWGGDIRDWTEVGVLRTQDDSAARYFYDLPNNLADDDLYICLKNMVTNEAKCVVSTR